jgi:hypothetical protein
MTLSKHPPPFKNLKKSDQAFYPILRTDTLGIFRFMQNHIGDLLWVRNVY